jgi:hypothetical protein
VVPVTLAAFSGERYSRLTVVHVLAAIPDKIAFPSEVCSLRNLIQTKRNNMRAGPWVAAENAILHRRGSPERSAPLAVSHESSQL